ncbi:hypothetical protein [Aquitalea pelogenes]|uniref:hypothetical protein n=1 Tax=Aquitalea pelogenes TaxID=1293573 RepID=UPI000A50C45A|nr:hypothetical protein [Aquitalea pelogenes]
MTARRVLLLMLLLCLLPPLAAWVSYHWWQPEAGKSYGRLLPLQALAIAGHATWPQGRWVLVTQQGAGACEQACQQRLHAMRQIHLALGEAAPRLRRVVLYQPPASPAQGDGLLALPGEVAGAQEPGFYLIDPQGRQLLFYADTLSPPAIIRELAMLFAGEYGLG